MAMTQKCRHHQSVNEPLDEYVINRVFSLSLVHTVAATAIFGLENVVAM